MLRDGLFILTNNGLLGSNCRKQAITPITESMSVIAIFRQLSETDELGVELSRSNRALASVEYGENLIHERKLGVTMSMTRSVSMRAVFSSAARALRSRWQFRLVEAEKSSMLAMLAMRCDLDHGCTVEVQPSLRRETIERV